MVQLEDTNSVHYCFSCGAEFEVLPTIEMEEEVTFCPYCGTEIDEEDLYDEYDDEQDDDFMGEYKN